VPFRQLDLDLHLKGLLLQRSTQGDQLRQNGLFTFDQEGVDLFGDLCGLCQQFLPRLLSTTGGRASASAVDHDVTHICGFARVDNLRVGIIWGALEGGRVVQRRNIHQNQVGAFARLQ